MSRRSLAGTAAATVLASLLIACCSAQTFSSLTMGVGAASTNGQTVALSTSRGKPGPAAAGAAAAGGSVLGVGLKLQPGLLDITPTTGSNRKEGDGGGDAAEGDAEPSPEVATRPTVRTLLSVRPVAYEAKPPSEQAPQGYTGGKAQEGGHEAAASSTENNGGKNDKSKKYKGAASPAKASAPPPQVCWTYSKRCCYEEMHAGYECKDYYAYKYARCHPVVEYRQVCGEVRETPSKHERPGRRVKVEESIIKNYDANYGPHVAGYPITGESEYYRTSSIPHRPYGVSAAPHPPPAAPQQYHHNGGYAGGQQQQQYAQPQAGYGAATGGAAPAYGGGYGAPASSYGRGQGGPSYGAPPVQQHPPAQQQAQAQKQHNEASVPKTPPQVSDETQKGKQADANQ